ncbi:MAG: hypothetical protein EOO65_01955 [Methanosarcinales archaeon]|nr:MAG: hypothetical protein EOO65_01955 [Methanosarcinales archaeon]
MVAPEALKNADVLNYAFDLFTLCLRTYLRCMTVCGAPFAGTVQHALLEAVHCQTPPPHDAFDTCIATDSGSFAFFSSSAASAVRSALSKRARFPSDAITAFQNFAPGCPYPAINGLLTVQALHSHMFKHDAEEQEFIIPLKSPWLNDPFFVLKVLRNFFMGLDDSSTDAYLAGATLDQVNDALDSLFAARHFMWHRVSLQAASFLDLPNLLRALCELNLVRRVCRNMMDVDGLCARALRSRASAAPVAARMQQVVHELQAVERMWNGFEANFLPSGGVQERIVDGEDVRAMGRDELYTPYTRFVGNVSWWRANIEARNAVRSAPRWVVGIDVLAGVVMSAAAAGDEDGSGSSLSPWTRIISSLALCTIPHADINRAIKEQRLAQAASNSDSREQVSSASADKFDGTDAAPVDGASDAERRGVEESKYDGGGEMLSAAPESSLSSLAALDGALDDEQEAECKPGNVETLSGALASALLSPNSRSVLHIASMCFEAMTALFQAAIALSPTCDNLSAENAEKALASAISVEKQLASWLLLLLCAQSSGVPVAALAGISPSALYAAHTMCNQLVIALRESMSTDDVLMSELTASCVLSLASLVSRRSASLPCEAPAACAPATVAFAEKPAMVRGSHASEHVISTADVTLAGHVADISRSEPVHNDSMATAEIVLSSTVTEARRSEPLSTEEAISASAATETRAVVSAGDVGTIQGGHTFAGESTLAAGGAAASSEFPALPPRAMYPAHWPPLPPMPPMTSLALVRQESGSVPQFVTDVHDLLRTATRVARKFCQQFNLPIVINSSVIADPNKSLRALKLLCATVANSSLMDIPDAWKFSRSVSITINVVQRVLHGDATFDTSRCRSLLTILRDVNAWLSASE